MSSARCPLCKRIVPSLRNLAGKVVLLPHSRTGEPVKFGATCVVRQ